VTIVDLIRERTFPIRDGISSLEKDIAAAIGERDAADERVKRCGTELTKQRAVEGERKKAFAVLSEKVVEAQRILEELEAKRREANEVLFLLQEEQRGLTKTHRAAQDAADEALSAIRSTQKEREKAEERTGRLGGELEKKKLTLRHAIRQALDAYLKSQAEHLEAAFHGQAEREESRRAFEEFREARHADPNVVGRLCDQREELQKFLSNATVPDVRDMLQKSLEAVEGQLVMRYPRALMPPPAALDSPIEDLLFYVSDRERVAFLLPIDRDAWMSATRGEETASASQALCFVWNFAQQLRLGPAEGDFVVTKGWPVFASHCSLEDVALLRDFALKCGGTVVARFALASVPPELEEVLRHEDQDG
jgi:hypothetical protein